MKKKAKKPTHKKALKRSSKPVKRNAKIRPLKACRESAVPIMNHEGNLMAGILYEPAKKSKTLVIVMHGWSGSRSQTHVRQMAVEIARAGFASYAFDRSGNGDSEGRFEDATPTKELRDILVVIEHFRKQYKRIILLGYSQGGMYALITAGRTKVEGVVAIAAPMHPENFAAQYFDAKQMEQLRSVGFAIIVKKRPLGDVPYTVTERFVDEEQSLRPAEFARGVSCPVLVAQGTGDESVPVSDSEELMAVLQKKDLLLIGGASHNFKNPQHLDALIDGIINWLRKL